MDLEHALANTQPACAELRGCPVARPFTLEQPSLAHRSIDLMSAHLHCLQNALIPPGTRTADVNPAVCSTYTVTRPCPMRNHDVSELRLSANGPAATVGASSSVESSGKQAKQLRSGRPPKLKKTRNQLIILRNYFQRDHRPARAALEMISKEACLTVNEVQNWFRNQRNRSRKMSSAPGSLCAEMPLPAMDDAGLQPFGPNYVLSPFEQPLFDVPSDNSCDAARGHTLQQLSELAEPTFPSLFCPRSLLEDVSGFCLQDQLRHFPIENRFLLRFQLLDKDSPERKEMLTALISSLSRGEKDRFLFAVKSHPPAQTISADQMCAMHPADRAWESVMEIFGIDEVKNVHDQPSPDSGQGSSSGHSSDTDSSCLPESVQLFDRDSALSFDGILDEQADNDYNGDNCDAACDAAMVYALTNMFKSHREYLHVVCRQLGYIPADKLADTRGGSVVSGMKHEDGQQSCTLSPS